MTNYTIPAGTVINLHDKLGTYIGWARSQKAVTYEEKDIVGIQMAQGSTISYYLFKLPATLPPNTRPSDSVIHSDAPIYSIGVYEDELTH